VLSFYPRAGFMHGFQVQGCTRFAVKLDFICGLLAKGSSAQSCAAPGA
jgi:4-hydroxyphenylacetate 3-monooxygenase